MSLYIHAATDELFNWLYGIPLHPRATTGMFYVKTNGKVDTLYAKGYMQVMCSVRQHAAADTGYQKANVVPITMRSSRAFVVSSNGLAGMGWL